MNPCCGRFACNVVSDSKSCLGSETVCRGLRSSLDTRYDVSHRSTRCLRSPTVPRGCQGQDPLLGMVPGNPGSAPGFRRSTFLPTIPGQPVLGSLLSFARSCESTDHWSGERILALGRTHLGTYQCFGRDLGEFHLAPVVKLSPLFLSYLSLIASGFMRGPSAVGSAVCPSDPQRYSVVCRLPQCGQLPRYRGRELETTRTVS